MQSNLEGGGVEDADLIGLTAAEQMSFGELYGMVSERRRQQKKMRVTLSKYLRSCGTPKKPFGLTARHRPSAADQRAISLTSFRQKTEKNKAALSFSFRVLLSYPSSAALMRKLSDDAVLFPFGTMVRATTGAL